MSRSSDCCSYEKRKDTYRYTHGDEAHWKVESEAGVVHIYAKEHQGLLEATRSQEESWKDSLPKTFRGSEALLKLLFRFWVSRSVRV